MKKSSLTQKIQFYFVNLKHWYLGTPERALDEAYRSASMIKSLETQHFNGEKIATDPIHYGGTTMDYFHSELQNHLKDVKLRLAEFHTSRLLISNYQHLSSAVSRYRSRHSVIDASLTHIIHNPETILTKLKFIDEVIGKYRVEDENFSDNNHLATTKDDSLQHHVKPQVTTIHQVETKKMGKAEEVSVVPRSIISTFNRIRSEFSPETEQEIVKKFRVSRRKTLISVRFLILLVFVPFLTYQISKPLIVGPIISGLGIVNENTVFLNAEMEERAFKELEIFENRIKFENLMGEETKIPVETAEIKLREKAHELTEEFRGESLDAIKNIFADTLGVIAFIWLLIVSKREIAILKDFIDQLVYGLSDSAKAFIIILFTDMFVGFHSPHGWEVLLSGFSRHLGLPENHNLIFLFIATVPVILDSIFKYWIFRYLNRISPSAVATYHSMNE